MLLTTIALLISGMLAASLMACSTSGQSTGANAAGATNSLTQTATAPTNKVSPGQTVFLNHCMGCHMGSGDPPSPNDIMTGSKKLTSLETFKAYVRNPNNGMMPAFPESQLSDADLATLYQYVSNLHKS